MALLDHPQGLEQLHLASQLYQSRWEYELSASETTSTWLGSKKCIPSSSNLQHMYNGGVLCSGVTHILRESKHNTRETNNKNTDLVILK